MKSMIDNIDIPVKHETIDVSELPYVP